MSESNGGISAICTRPGAATVSPVRVCASLRADAPMLRREFIILFAGVGIVAPFSAQAQQTKIPRVGYVWIGMRATDVSSAGLHDAAKRLDRWCKLSRTQNIASRLLSTRYW
jgi:hypothetical protein